MKAAWKEKISNKIMCGMQVSGYRVGENLQSLSSIGEKPSVQQNQNPVIFHANEKIDGQLNMSAAHSNIARLVTQNENGATSIANAAKKETFTEDITLSSALEKLQNSQEYNEDMKAVVLSSVEKASMAEDKIAVLEKGLAFLETEKKLSELVQSGKMELDYAKELLTSYLNSGCKKEFSLEKLNQINEKLTQLNENKSSEKEDSSIKETVSPNKIQGNQDNVSKLMNAEIIPDEEEMKDGNEKLVKNLPIMQPLQAVVVKEEFPQPEMATIPTEMLPLEEAAMTTVLEEAKCEVFHLIEHGEKLKEVFTTQQQQQPESESVSLSVDNSPLEVVNQSVQELVENWEVPTLIENKKTELDQKSEKLDTEISKSSEQVSFTLWNVEDFTQKYNTLSGSKKAEAFIALCQKADTDKEGNAFTNLMQNRFDDLVADALAQTGDKEAVNNLLQNNNFKGTKAYELMKQKLLLVLCSPAGGKIFSKDKETYVAAFNQLESLAENNPSIKEDPLYGLAMLRHDQKKITKEPKYKQWKSKNEPRNKDLLDRVCLEGMKFQEGKEIPLTLHKMQLLKDANKDTEEPSQDFKTRPMYGLYLLQKNEKRKFQKWSTTTEGERRVDSVAFTELKERLCLEGTSNQDGKGIRLSAEDILKLAEFDSNIKDTPVYGLVLFKQGNKEEFQKWSTTTTNGEYFDSDAFTELKERLCLEGMSHYSGKGIILSADDIVKLGEFDDGIKKTTSYQLANALNEGGIKLNPGEELKELRKRAYVAGTPNPPENGIAVPVEVYKEIYYFSFDEAKELVDKTNSNEKLGEGSFGVVHKVKGNDGKTYAVKIAKSADAKDDFLQEKKANEYLQANLSEEERNYFVDYYGGFEIDGKYVFITEFIDKPKEGRNAPFDKYINDVYEKGCSADDLSTMTKLLQQGFEKVAIEQRIGLLNRDVKPENFMVSEDAKGKLQLKGMDYGTACTYTGIADPDLKGVGSPAYMSPEILLKQPYTFSSDVYSMGISLLDGLFGGSFPKENFKFPWKIAEYVQYGKLSEALKDRSFDMLAEDKVITQEALNNLKETLGEDADKKIGFLASLVADCTAFNPQERISAKQAAYLLEEFNKGEFSDYKDAKQNAINTHPKAIPDVIKNMISSEDLDTKDQGVEALKKLILADPSYIETKDFKNLDEMVASEIENSEEYKSAFEKLKNKEVKDDALSTENTVSATKAESISSVQPQGLNVDLDNEFAGAAIIQELETILSDNYGALVQVQDFMLSANYDARKLNEFLSFVQGNLNNQDAITKKASELFSNNS